MIFVTGATGTVGSATLKALKAKGVPMKAGSRHPEKAQVQLGVDTVAWDWDHPQAFAAALKGVDALFLLTPPGTTTEKAYGLSAVEAAKAAGVKKIVKLSAIGIENMPDSPHRQIELAIEAGPFQWVFLRPNFFMQNLDEGMADGIKHAGVISVPTGDGRTSMIDARDIGAVAAEALTRDDLNGQGLTLTGSEALSYADVAAQLGQVIGKPVRHDDVAASAYTTALKGYGVPAHYAEFLTMLYDQVVRHGHTAPVTDLVKTVTGREPIKLAQYAQDHAAAFKA